MKKLLPLILSGIITLFTSVALAIDYQTLQPKQLNLRDGYSEVVTGSMPSNSIQIIYFQANYKDIISIIPDTSSGYNNITLRVYDINNNIVADEFGRAIDTYIVFEAPRTGTYEFYIVTSSQNNYSYKIKRE